jgi:surface antigen
MHKLFSTVALCVALAACAGSEPTEHADPGPVSTKEPTGGAVVGASAGALVGTQIAASLDRADLMALNSTTLNALENVLPNQATPWRNSDSGSYGTVTPGPVYQASGQYCREFQQTIVVGGQQQHGSGRACRRRDGSWQIAP